MAFSGKRLRRALFSPHAPRFKCPLFFRGFPFARRQNPARQPYSARRLRTAAPALFFCLLLALSPVSGGCQAEARPENADGIRQAYEAFQSGDPSLDRFGELAHTVFMEEAVSDTLTLHYRLAAPEDFGVAGHTPTLGDFSAEAYQESARRAASYWERLKAIPRDPLPADTQLTYDILSASLTLSVQLGDYYYYQEPLKPTGGLQAQLPVLLAEYHFRSAQDIEDYLALCADVPRYFAQILAFEQEKAQAGLFMPDAVLEQILAQCRDFCADPENHFMIAAFAQALEGLNWLAPEEKLALREENRQILLARMIPAYEALAQGLEALRGQGRGEGGLCFLEQGRDYYRLLVRQATGSSRTPEELIRLVSERMLNDLRAMSQIYETTADLGKQLTQTFSLTDPELILLDLQSQMRSDFPALPGISCEVKYVPEALEGHLSPAFYLVPPLDALTENCIYINRAAADPARLYTTLAHEGYPGHLYQTVYSASCQAEPLRSLLSFKGFTEGWATYAERLAYGYEESFSPELQEFLARNASATLALYALCDLNVHYNGWSLEETGRFLRTFIKGLDDEAIRQIYLAVVAAPANYLSYHVGAMEFELLREEAETRLGDAFDAREFHTVILTAGPCPFDVLQACVEEWMAGAAGA